MAQVCSLFVQSPHERSAPGHPFESETSSALFFYLCCVDALHLCLRIASYSHGLPNSLGSMGCSFSGDCESSSMFSFDGIGSHCAWRRGCRTRRAFKVEVRSCPCHVTWLRFLFRAASSIYGMIPTSYALLSLSRSCPSTLHINNRLPGIKMSTEVSLSLFGGALSVDVWGCSSRCSSPTRWQLRHPLRFLDGVSVSVVVYPLFTWRRVFFQLQQSREIAA